MICSNHHTRSRSGCRLTATCLLLLAVGVPTPAAAQQSADPVPPLVEETAPPPQPAPSDESTNDPSENPEESASSQPADEPTSDPSDPAQPEDGPTEATPNDPATTAAPADSVALGDADPNGTDPYGTSTAEADSEPLEPALDSDYESSAPPELEPVKPPSPFRQGGIQVGLGVGWASTSRESWTILGAGVGVFVFDGVQVELGSTFWLGGDPFVATITPALRYVFHFVPMVQPYVGTFYRHYFLDSGYLDTDSIGARGGVYFSLGKHVIVGGGIAYEHFLDDDVFTRRDDVYPELSIAAIF